MIDENLKQYEPFFGKWRISKELGKGAFGSVYEIYWDDGLGSRSVSALKYMHIPSKEAFEEQKVQQPDMEAVRNYFLQKVERIKDEIRILQKCKGHSNIVCYEDHAIEEHVGEEDFGWDILIRMELLYPLNTILNWKDGTQYDVIRLWRDIANALIYCEDQNIIHRDIKPANILIAEAGQYKLSDFGVARKNMEQDAASTRVGTVKYMAPEVYNNQKYDKRADYYSLGCVIYYYLNRNRLPFYPPYPQQLEQKDLDLADEKRVKKGEKVPPVKGVSKEINEILLKSLSFNPAKRQRSARELYRDIQKIMETQGSSLRQKHLGEIQEAKNGKEKTEKPSEKSRNLPIILAAVLLVAGIGGVAYGLSMKKTETGSSSENGPSWNGKAIEETKESFSEYMENEPVSESIAETESEIQTETQSETETESETQTETETESETQTETETESETQSETETESETQSETETESETQSETETESETQSETETESETQSETETESETQSETETESETQTETETESETQTETETESETQTETETESETQTETETESETQTETETETEMPVPTARLFGNVERPADGDTIVKTIKAKGWILANEEVGEISSYLDIRSDGKVVASIALDQQEMGENSFEKRQKKNSSEIAAVKGYELKCSESVEDIPDGSYEVCLRVTEGENETILSTALVTIANGQAKNKEDLMTYMGIEEEQTELALHYIYQEKGFAVGLDEESISSSENAAQLLLTGWINAPEGTSLGTYVNVDDTVYTADSLAEQGGSVEVIRAPRYLEGMDKDLIGGSVQDTKESGYIITLALPFLNAGTHTIAVSLNVGVPGEEPELVEMQPVQIEVDPSAPVNADAAEQIEKKWENEFPVPLETEEKETEEQK